MHAMRPNNTHFCLSQGGHVRFTSYKLSDRHFNSSNLYIKLHTLAQSKYMPQEFCSKRTRQNCHTCIWINVKHRYSFHRFCFDIEARSRTAAYNKVSPRERRDDMPPLMAVRRWHIVSLPIKNRGGSTSVRGRVRSPHISGSRRWLSCRQPACL